jgi:hypothetical protein
MMYLFICLGKNWTDRKNAKATMIDMIEHKIKASFELKKMLRDFSPLFYKIWFLAS